MAKRKILHQGRSKDISEGDAPDTHILSFKDETTGFDQASPVTIAGKGVLNNRISAHLMTKLEGIGIATHFLNSLNMREQVIRPLEMHPFSVHVRNIAAGSLCDRLGVKEGFVPRQPIIEFYARNPASGNPIMSEHHLMGMGWVDGYELEEVLHRALRANDYLNGLYAGIGLSLVDIRFEFGRRYSEYGELYLFLGDEISPETCRLWDSVTKEKIGRERVGEAPEAVIEGYQRVAHGLGLVPKGGIVEGGAVNEQIASSLGEIDNELAKARRLRALKAPGAPRKV